MTIWSNDPPREPGFNSYKLLRCPPKGTIRCIVLSHFPVGCDLHYWKGRSVPCKHTECDACKGGNRPRWKGYLFVKSLATNNVAILEYTARAHDAIQTFLATYPNIRGAKMTLTRTGARPNSPILITFDEGRADETFLPDPQGLQECLERMWEVKQQEIPEIAAELREEIRTRALANGHAEAPTTAQPNRFATMTNGQKP